MRSQPGGEMHKAGRAVAVLIAGLGSAVALAACGGGTKTVLSTTTVFQTVTAQASTSSTTSATAAAATPSGPPDCGAAGINPTKLKEGTCTTNGQTIVVVNKGSTLH